MTTKTRQAANLVGRNGYMFNDRLLNGRRSLKVYGWTYEDYKKCADILKISGVYSYIKNGPFSMSTHRLIVEEG